MVADLSLAPVSTGGGTADFSGRRGQGILILLDIAKPGARLTS
jgi:hypothetical protein